MFCHDSCVKCQNTELKEECTSLSVPHINATRDQTQSNPTSSKFFSPQTVSNPCPTSPGNLQCRDTGASLVAHHATELLGKDVVLQADAAWQHFGELSLQVWTDLGHVAHGEEDLDAPLQYFRRHPAVVSPHGLDAFGVKRWFFLVTGFIHEAHVPLLGLKHAWQVYLKGRRKKHNFASVVFLCFMITRNETRKIYIYVYLSEKMTSSCGLLFLFVFAMVLLCFIFHFN